MLNRFTSVWMWMCAYACPCALPACNYVYYAKHVGTPLSCRWTGLGLAVSAVLVYSQPCFCSLFWNHCAWEFVCTRLFFFSLNWLASHHWCPLPVFLMHVLSLCCESLIRGSRGALGAGGNSWSRGSGGLSAQGSRCCSLFHCSPYGPAVLGPRGPVSATPPRPGLCHQAPLASCLTPALGPTSTFHTWTPPPLKFFFFFNRHLLSFTPKNVGFWYYYEFISLTISSDLLKPVFMSLSMDKSSYNIKLFLTAYPNYA